MAAEEYSPAFSKSMNEILMFLDFFEKEEEAPAPSEVPAAKTVEPPAPAPRKPEPASPEPEPEPEPAPAKPEPVPPSTAAPEDVLPIELDTPTVATAELSPPSPASVEEIDILSEILGPEPLDDETDRLVEQLLQEEAAAEEIIEQPPPSAPLPVEDVHLPSPVPGDALALYTEMLKLDPTSSVFVRLAEELSTRGLWNDTVEVCRRGLLHHPANLRARVLLGLALREMDETREASLVLTEARIDIEKNVLLYRVLAEIAGDEGDVSQAEHLMHIYETFRERIRHLPDHATARPMEPLSRRQPAVAFGPASPVEERLIHALTLLLAQIDVRKPAPAPPSRLFSAGSREKLKKALSSRAS